MNYKKLGNTDLDVSTICLGTMTWGEHKVKGKKYLIYCLDHNQNFLI